jgi:hypothetical protein
VPRRDLVIWGTESLLRPGMERLWLEQNHGQGSVHARQASTFFVFYDRALDPSGWDGDLLDDNWMGALPFVSRDRQWTKVLWGEGRNGSIQIWLSPIRIWEIIRATSQSRGTDQGSGRADVEVDPVLNLCVSWRDWELLGTIQRCLPSGLDSGYG